MRPTDSTTRSERPAMLPWASSWAHMVFFKEDGVVSILGVHEQTRSYFPNRYVTPIPTDQPSGIGIPKSCSRCRQKLDSKPSLHGGMRLPPSPSPTPATSRRLWAPHASRRLPETEDFEVLPAVGEFVPIRQRLQRALQDPGFSFHIKPARPLHQDRRELAIRVGARLPHREAEADAPKQEAATEEKEKSKGEADTGTNLDLPF